VTAIATIITFVTFVGSNFCFPKTSTNCIFYGNRSYHRSYCNYCKNHSTVVQQDKQDSMVVQQDTHKVQHIRKKAAMLWEHGQAAWEAWTPIDKATKVNNVTNIFS